MKPIINEWQLDSRLNIALQNKHQADFSLFLALLSSAVQESAEFLTPDSLVQVKPSHTLQKQFHLATVRSFAWQDDDEAQIINYGQAIQHSGLNQAKLLGYLKPEPLVFEDNKTKLPIELWQSLDMHSKRRLMATQPLQKATANPAALYEVLQKLHETEAA